MDALVAAYGGSSEDEDDVDEAPKQQSSMPATGVVQNNSQENQQSQFARNHPNGPILSAQSEQSARKNKASDILRQLQAKKKQRKAEEGMTITQRVELLEATVTEEEVVPVAARTIPEDGASLAAALPPPKNVDRLSALGSNAQAWDEGEADPVTAAGEEYDFSIQPSHETDKYRVDGEGLAPVIVDPETAEPLPAQPQDPRYSDAPATADEQVEALVRSGRAQNIQFKEISAADVQYVSPAERAAMEGARSAIGKDLMEQVAEEAANAPGKRAKQKHQIGTLYHQMRMNQLQELQAKESSAKNKAATKAKYGW